MQLLGLAMAIALLTLSVVGSASASIVEYTRAAAFNADVVGTTTDNFEGIVPVGTYSSVNPTVAGATFTAAPSYNLPLVIGNGLYGVKITGFQVAAVPRQRNPREENVLIQADGAAVD
ncbi:MAG: hypothetical protein ACYC7I_01990 [Gammaproteobacteria bacterium]